MQIFCFAHAGGGPALFRPWRDRLAPEAMVRPVLLPGRESRLSEPPFRRMADLIGPLCEALEPQLAQEYALFGHSMGAAVAYEVARRFSEAGRPGPACLLVSGRAPRLMAGRRQVHDLPDEEFLAEVKRLNGMPPEVLDEPELISMLLPVLRADYQLAETYRPLPGRQLRCPVTAYLSTSDPEVSEQEMLRWKQVTTGEFAMRIFRGDHFYLKGDRPDVLNAVREDLSLARASRGRDSMAGR
ncbi:MAG: thioesterase [Streptosporangiaceae bacterium]|nr:thioesterase [Streptosporangiaceae bacterium]